MTQQYLSLSGAADMIDVPAHVLAYRFERDRFPDPDVMIGLAGLERDVKCGWLLSRVQRYKEATAVHPHDWKRLRQHMFWRRRPFAYLSLNDIGALWGCRPRAMKSRLYRGGLPEASVSLHQFRSSKAGARTVRGWTFEDILVHSAGISMRVDEQVKADIIARLRSR